MSGDTPDWDARYAGRDPREAQPAQVLLDFAHLLPAQGRALDLACGLGANALFLAHRGLDTAAWDSSPTAIAALERTAVGLGLATEIRDVVADPPPAEAFDVIVVSRFLERALAPRLADALRPGGLLFYQTFGPAVDPARGPRRPAFRLARGELPRLFPTLALCVYREEGALGDTTQGLRDEVYAVFRRLPGGLADPPLPA